jgi:hypothetical protein
MDIAAAARLSVTGDCGPRRRIFRHVNRTAADDRTATGAGAEFRQSHSYRHNSIPVPGRPQWMKGLAPIHRGCGSSEQMQTIPLSASALTILCPKNGGFRACSGLSVPLLNSFPGGVNGGRRGFFGGDG